MKTSAEKGLASHSSIKNNELSTSTIDKDRSNSKENVDTSSNSTVMNSHKNNADINSRKFIKSVSTSSKKYKPVVDDSHKDFAVLQVWFVDKNIKWLK